MIHCYLAVVLIYSVFSFGLKLTKQPLSEALPISMVETEDMPKYVLASTASFRKFALGFSKCDRNFDYFPIFLENKAWGKGFYNSTLLGDAVKGKQEGRIMKTRPGNGEHSAQLCKKSICFQWGLRRERAELSIASWITPWFVRTWGRTDPLPPPSLRDHPLRHRLPCTSGVTVENRKHLAGKQQPNVTVEASSMKAAESGLLRWAGLMNMCWESPFLPSASTVQHQRRSQKLDYGTCRRLRKAHSRGRGSREKLVQKAMRAEQVELVVTRWQESSKKFPPMPIRTSPSEFTST